MNKREQALDFVKQWYVGGAVVTIMMDAESEDEDYCIQTMVVELLKDLIETPIPNNIKEGTPAFNTWIDVAFRKVMRGLDFGFTLEQEDAVKNLAYNYWIDGVRAVLNQPELIKRRYKCVRRSAEKEAYNG